MASHGLAPTYAVFCAISPAPPLRSCTASRRWNTRCSRYISPLNDRDALTRKTSQRKGRPTWSPPRDEDVVAGGSFSRLRLLVSLKQLPQKLHVQTNRPHQRSRPSPQRHTIARRGECQTVPATACSARLCICGAVRCDTKGSYDCLASEHLLRSLS